MAKSRKDPHVHRPDPTLTPQEVMAEIDARNMINLVRDLTTYMPSPYKEKLLRDGSIQVKLGRYTVMIVVNGRFEQPVGEYGRADW